MVVFLLLPVSQTQSVASHTTMACDDRSTVADRVCLLERCVRKLEDLISARLSLDDTGTPVSGSRRLDSRPACDSINVASSAAEVEFVPVERRGKACKSSQPIVWPALQSPLTTANWFLSLASPVGRPVGLPASSASADGVKQPTLVIGDSITRNIRLVMSAIVCWIPAARASDIEANLRVLASCRDVALAT